jgi:hypothetical protein
VPRRTIARHEVHTGMRLRRDARERLAKALKVKVSQRIAMILNRVALRTHEGIHSSTKT